MLSQGSNHQERLSELSASLQEEALQLACNQNCRRRC
nr:unnamed protein product [Callosobruchus chinensis]